MEKSKQIQTNLKKIKKKPKILKLSKMVKKLEKLKKIKNPQKITFKKREKNVTKKCGGGHDSTRALKSSPMQNPRGVP